MSRTSRTWASPLSIVVGAFFCSSAALADIWVFEPSVSLDQRVDDNYFLLPEVSSALSATRVVGELGLSRESQTYVIKGLARVDGLLTTNTDVGDEDLDSNQIFILDVSARTPRSRYGVTVNYKQDTPSRDIAADISDVASLAEDTGLVDTQTLNNNVARTEIVIEPRWTYDITRRLEFDVDLAFTDVEHGLPVPQDAIYERYLSDRNRRIRNGEILDPVLPYDAVSVQTEGVGVFSPIGELDDFQETEIDLGLRYKLTPIATATTSLRVSRFVSEVLPAPEVSFTEFQLIPDERERSIVRRPRRDLTSTTADLTLGYERFLRPNLQFVIQAGLYETTTDNSDTYRPSDTLGQGAETPTVGKTDTNGWLTNVTLAYDAGATRYTGRFAVDVQPSSAGSQIETNELTGEMRRVLSPRLDFSFRARAFEPDRLVVREADRFARRFISFEPRIQWKYSRNWTLSAAYRYRRQKARIDPVSSESNAVLFAIKYTPPSEIRDRARASGL